EQVGAPAAVYRRPATRFVAGFIGSPPMNMLPARIAGPGSITLDGDSMRELACNAGSLAVGTAVIAGFRPEDMRVAAAADAGAMSFATDMVEELGASKLLHGRLAGGECVASLPSGMAAATNGALLVRISPESIHLFDAQTGLRIS